MAKEESEKSVEQVESARRDFLVKAAKIAVYTPPAMLLMSKPSYATFKTSGGTHNFYPSSRTTFRRHSSFNNLFSWIRSWFR